MCVCVCVCVCVCMCVCVCVCVRGGLTADSFEGIRGTHMLRKFEGRWVATMTLTAPYRATRRPYKKKNQYLLAQR